MTKTLRAIDICAGAGGWACAADRLTGKPIKIVAAIDFAEDCLATYKYNHDKPGGVAEGAEFICSDAREVDYLKWKGIDLAIGGNKICLDCGLSLRFEYGVGVEIIKLHPDFDYKNHVLDEENIFDEWEKDGNQ